MGHPRPLSVSPPVPTTSVPRWRFDRHELAGAFGDIGTDLPLLVALVAQCALDPASVFTLFGALQIATGLFYGLPMPVQPLKAMAAIMLAQRLGAGTLAGGGLVVGASMLLLTATGLLERLARIVPKEVVRGLQLGLAVTLGSTAVLQYAGAGGPRGYGLALAAVLGLVLLRGQRRVPGPLLVIGAGLAYGLMTTDGNVGLAAAVGLRWPSFHAPTAREFADGALLLALPQLPLSLGNSVIATSQASRDLFPDRPVPVRRIGFTYGLMNLVAPWFGGVPACHGCGGMVGFHAFGARTGGAPLIYGALYLVLGLFFSGGFDRVVGLFPLPILGAVLLFEALALASLARDVAGDRRQVLVALATAAAVVCLPYGYAVGLAAGTALSWSRRRGGGDPGPV